MASAAASANAHTVLGSGRYGAVFAPALPNINEHGALKEYPENVTKMFYDPETFERTLEKLDRAEKYMGEDAVHRRHGYAKNYSMNNLPAALQSELSEHTDLNAINSRLLLMRMPYLGVDIGHLDESVLTKLRSLPFETFAKQIQKLLHMTSKLGTHGYGHYDIRERNVVVHPENGEINIIDYDLFDSFGELYGEAPFGFYSYPPETLLHWNKYNSEKKRFFDIWKIVMNTSKPLTESFIRERLNPEYAENYFELNIKAFGDAWSKYFGIKSADELKDAVVKANVETISHLRSFTDSDERSLFEGYIMYHVDNYGLGLTLLQLLAKLYPEDNPHPAYPKVVDLLKRMAALRLEERPEPYKNIYETVPKITAADEMDAIVTAGAVGGRRKTRRGKKHGRSTRKMWWTRPRNCNLYKGLKVYRDGFTK